MPAAYPRTTREPSANGCEQPTARHRGTPTDPIPAGFPPALSSAPASVCLHSEQRSLRLETEYTYPYTETIRYSDSIQSNQCRSPGETPLGHQPSRELFITDAEALNYHAPNGLAGVNTPRVSCDSLPKHQGYLPMQKRPSASQRGGGLRHRGAGPARKLFVLLRGVLWRVVSVNRNIVGM